MKNSVRGYIGLVVVSAIGLVTYNNCSSSSSNSNPGDGTNFNQGQVCTPGVSPNPAAVNTKTLNVSPTDNNVVPMTVGCGYVNQPCISVTICSPGGGNCQTIPNLLLDTGSYGLRIFDNATTTGGTTLDTKNLKTVPNLYECISYVDGTYQWGGVMVADVTLGAQTASSVPIQIIEANPTTETPNVPTACVNQQGSPGTADVASAGYNGILGVGLFGPDCGAGCVNEVNNNIYFTCTGNNCTGSSASLTNQVTNPVAMLGANYNNGVIIQLDNVPDSGATTSSGYMILGIGTTANNTPPAGVKMYQASPDGNFQTQFGTQSFASSFIDSGSNGIFFPNGCIAIDAGGFFEPPNEVGFSATQSSYNSSANATVVTLNSKNINPFPTMKVWNNLAGDMDGSFDWGLPFFLGRTVYVGLDAKKSSLGTGPYWAY